MNTAESRIIEIYQKIYEIRKNCGLQRQGNHAGDFQALDENLRDSIKQSHPYELTYWQKKSLEGVVSNYERGGNGLPAKINCDGYLYRIANQIDIYTNTKTIDFSTDDVADSATNFWNKLYRLSMGGKNWLRLSDYGDKPYATLCHISWWTHHELEQEAGDMIEKANRLGLFENWVDNEIYLLRCPAAICAEPKIASVPTIIDAYASSVFYTTEDSKSPAEGVTINLSLAPNLQLGLSEVVLKEIELDYMEIKPIKIEPEQRRKSAHIASKNLRMLETLKAYYEQLF